MPDKDTFSKRETSLWTLLPAHHKTVRLLWCGGGLFLEGLKGADWSPPQLQLLMVYCSF